VRAAGGTCAGFNEARPQGRQRWLGGDTRHSTAAAQVTFDLCHFSGFLSPGADVYICTSRYVEAYWQKLRHNSALFLKQFWEKAFCPPSHVRHFVFLGVVILPTRCVYHTLVAKQAQSKSSCMLHIPYASGDKHMCKCEGASSASHVFVLGLALLSQPTPTLLAWPSRAPKHTRRIGPSILHL
jgi:hypothetical protein